MNLLYSLHVENRVIVRSVSIVLGLGILVDTPYLARTMVVAGESSPFVIFIVSTKAGWQCTLGYTHGSRLSADRCASYELDGDARYK